VRGMGGGGLSERRGTEQNIKVSPSKYLFLYHRISGGGLEVVVPQLRTSNHQFVITRALHFAQ